MKNNFMYPQAPYLRNSVAFDHEFWYTCVNDDISKHFFSFY